MTQQTVYLAEGETAIVGYGSLLSEASLSRTLGRPYDGPFLTCHIAGWLRTWNVGMPNQAFYYERAGTRIYPKRILYLNVRRDSIATMNAALFVLRTADLEAMDGREWIYYRHVLNKDLIDVRVMGGDIAMYVAREEYVVPHVTEPRDAAVRSSYLGMLGAALQLRDAAFQEEYARSTDPAPQNLVVDDQLDPERPSPWLGKSYRPENANQRV